jgi:hypothetical protein
VRYGRDEPITYLKYGQEAKVKGITTNNDSDYIAKHESYILIWILQAVHNQNTQEHSTSCIAHPLTQAAGLARSDVVVMAPDGTLFLLDIVVTHQHVGCKLAECHGHTGKAAALAAADKQRQFRLHGDAEQYTFVPFAVESHGQLCKEAVDFLHMSAEWGAGSGLQRAGKGESLMSFYHEISCVLQRGNGVMYGKSAERLIRAQGRHFMPGAAVPSPWGGSV